jgi:hypothetical protein
MSEDQEEQQEQSTFSAIEVATYIAEAATRFAESAAAYAQAITADPRPVVEVDGYYAAYDGSTVRIVRRHNQCKCPICGGQQTTPLSPLFALVGQMMQVPPQHQESDDTAPMFVGLIVKGGHGLPKVPGEEPGHRLVYDANGFPVMTNPKRDDGNEYITTGQIALIGLSLKRRLRVTME